MNSFSLRYFGADNAGFGYYSRARFREKSVRVKLLALWRYLGFELLVNTFPRFRRFWEHYLASWCAGKVIEWRLVKVGTTASSLLAPERLAAAPGKAAAAVISGTPGARAERILRIDFFRNSAIRVVARNWRAEDGSGELDLVAWDGQIWSSWRSRAALDGVWTSRRGG